MRVIRVGDKWHAYSRAGGKKVYVGSFDSKRAATEAADWGRSAESASARSASQRRESNTLRPAQRITLAGHRLVR